MTRDFQAGSKIGTYVLDTYVGGGSFGAVWRGHDERSGQAVAIKLLTGALSSSETAAMRADVELLAASAASHSQHVVHVLGGGVDPVPHIVMEYVEGNDLSALLKAKGKLTAEETIDIGISISDALGALNEAGIIHRDIKPANVMTDKDGVIKLADFGIAKIVGYETMTMTGQAAMTMAYAAPEIWDDGSAFGRPSHKSDLYAMGVLLYQCLTGETPFRGNYGALYKAHLERAPDIKALPPATPPSLRTLIQLCLEKKQADRPSDAIECMHMLERSRTELAGSAAAAGEPRQFGPWIKIAPHESQPWAWRCRHESRDTLATVEVHFADTLDDGAILRRALAANPKLTPLGAERLIETNRLLLRPDESWQSPPAGRFQFWIAREDREVEHAAVVTAAGLTAATTALAALIAAGEQDNLSLAIKDNLTVLANGEIYLRRPGIDAMPADSEFEAWEAIRALPLDPAATALVSSARDFRELVDKLSAADTEGTVIVGRGDQTVVVGRGAGDTVIAGREQGTPEAPEPAAVLTPRSPAVPLAAPALALQLSRTSAGKAASWYELTLRNQGEGPMDVRLDARDPANALAFSLPQQVMLAQGANDRVRVHVQPRKGRMFGGKRSFRFTITAAGAGGGGNEPPITVEGEFEDQPPSWPLFAGAGFFGIAILAVLTALALAGGNDNGGSPKLALAETATATATAVPSATPVPPTATPIPPPLPTEVPPPPPEPNRANCNAIRGTAYQSSTEEAWFRANCITPGGGGAPAATSTPIPPPPPGGGGGPPPPAPTATPRPPTTYSMTAALNATTYVRNQGFTLCYRLNPQGVRFHVRLFESINGVSQGLQTEWDDDGALNGAWNDCIGNLRWDNQAGARQLRLEASVNGVVVAQATVSANVN